MCESQLLRARNGTSRLQVTSSLVEGQQLDCALPLSQLSQPFSDCSKLDLERGEIVALHLNETTVGVECEAIVVGQLGEALYGLIVKSAVEHRVHHARH